MSVHTLREFCDLVAKELIPRVSLEDETTNKGSGDVVMKFLRNVGMVKFNTETNMWELGDGWMEPLLVSVGDGVTMARTRNFQRDLR